MSKKILSVVILVVMLATSLCAFAEPATEVPATTDAQPTDATGQVPVEEVPAGEVPTEAAPAEPAYTPIKDLMAQSGMSVENQEKNPPVCVTSATFDKKSGAVTLVITNVSSKEYKVAYVMETDENGVFEVVDVQQYSMNGTAVAKEDRMCSSLGQVTIPAGEEVEVKEKAIAKNGTPKFNLFIQYTPAEATVSNQEALKSGLGEGYTYIEDVMNPKNLKNAASGAKGGALGKIGKYLLDNILAVIALIIALLLLAYTIIKNLPKASAEVKAEDEAEESEDETIGANDVSADVEAEETAVESSEETEGQENEAE